MGCSLSQQLQQLTTKLEQLRLRQAIIDRIVQGIQEALVLAELLPTTAAQLQTALGASRCLIFQTDSDRQITACYLSSATNDQGETMSDLAQTLQTRFNQSLSRGQAVVLSQSDMSLASNALIVPLMYQQEYLGSTILESDRALDAQAVEFVKRVGAHWAIALGQAAVVAKWRNRVENNQDLLWEMDENYIYTYVSPQVQSILGYSPAEILGKRALDLMPSSEAPINDEKKLPFNCVQNKNIHKDGQIIVMESSGVPIFDKQGNFRGYRGIARDITERKQAESKARLAQFFLDRAKDAVYFTDREGQFVQVNEAACRQLGYSRSQLLTMKVQDIDKNYPSQVWPEHWEELQQRGSFSIESTHRARDGREFPVEISLNYLEFNGKAYNCAIARDITERQQTESALGEREARFRHIFADSPMAIALCDREGNLLQVNQAFCLLLGYTESELLQMNFSQFTHPEDIEAEITYFGQCIEGKISSYKIEKRYIDRQGKIIWVNLSVGVILGSEGKMRYGLGMVFDITERKETEERLRLTDRAIAASSNGIIICDARLPEQPIIYVNPAFERITGYSASEAIGRKFLFWQGEETNQSEVEKSGTVLLVNYRQDGTRFWNELSRAPIYDDEGNLTHYISIQNDITDRQIAAAQLRATTSGCGL